MAKSAKTADLVVSDEARGGFYPTPPAMVDLLLAGIEWRENG